MRRVIIEYDLPDHPDNNVFTLIDFTYAKKRDLFRVTQDGYFELYVQAKDMWFRSFYEGEMFIESMPQCHQLIKYVLMFIDGKVSQAWLHPDHYLIEHLYKPIN